MCRGEIMFNNTARKIKICAYIYFIGNMMITVNYDISHFIEFGGGVHLLIETVFNSIHSFVMYLVLALIIYGFGNVVRYFELLNKQ